jgi:hypothetical protein
MVLEVRRLDTATAVTSRVERATAYDVVAHAFRPVFVVCGWKLRHELATSSRKIHEGCDDKKGEGRI